MQVVGGVVSESAQVEAFQQFELLKEHRALAPRAALQDFHSTVGDVGGVFDLGTLSAEVSEVFKRK